MVVFVVSVEVAGLIGGIIGAAVAVVVTVCPCPGMKFHSFSRRFLSSEKACRSSR